jgi:hypothetical protein
LSPIQSTYTQVSSMPVQNNQANTVIPIFSLQEENISFRIPELDENEIRKAIIYSEIINRKYF